MEDLRFALREQKVDDCNSAMLYSLPNQQKKKPSFRKCVFLFIINCYLGYYCGYDVRLFKKMTKMFAFNRKVVFLQNRNMCFGNVYFYL